MAIPPRDIWRIKTCQCSTFNNDVFKNFIDCMTNMYITVGIRRAIVQNEFWPSFTNFTNLLIQFFILPVFEHHGLTLSKVTAHWKKCIRQIKCFLIICHEILFFIFSDDCELKKYFLAFSTSYPICLVSASRSGYFSSSRSFCKKSTRK